MYYTLSKIRLKEKEFIIQSQANLRAFVLNVSVEIFLYFLYYILINNIMITLNVYTFFNSKFEREMKLSYNPRASESVGCLSQIGRVCFVYTDITHIH